MKFKESFFLNTSVSWGARVRNLGAVALGFVVAVPFLAGASGERVDLLASRLERQLALIEALDAEFRSLEERLGRPLAAPVEREEEVESATNEEVAPAPPAVAAVEPEPEVQLPPVSEPEPEPVAVAEVEVEHEVEVRTETTVEPERPAVATAPRRSQPGLDEIETELGAEDSGRFHVVQPGDTLTRIAGNYEISLQELLDVNPNVDPRRLRPGQRVRLPSTAAAGAEAAVSEVVDRPEDADAGEAPTARPPARPATHVVGSGETLSSIAARYQTSVEVLMELNAITDPRRLQAGQTLLLPRNGAGGPEVPEVQVEVLVDEEEDARPRLYTVRPGDTLARIGAREGISVERIRQLNPGIDGDRIYPGQIFRLRADVPIEETRMRPNPGASAIPQVEETFGLYRVREGDSLTSVARDFFVSRDEIANWNDLDRDATLRTGQSLRLPQSVIDARAAQQDGR